MYTLLQESGLQQHFLAALLGLPRLVVIMTVVPFFGNNVLSGQLQMAVAISLYLLLHPLVYTQGIPVSFDWFVILALLGKEILLGFFLAWLSSMPFWLVQGAGSFMDNQRGDSMAELSDPLSGDSTSPIGSLLFQVLVFLFFSSGAFLVFLTLLYGSYLVWPVPQALPSLDLTVVLFFIRQLSWLMVHVLLLAGPITVACLLVDTSLGLMNRFASQLNVYVLAMPIKSGIVALLLIIYLGIFVQYAPKLFSNMSIVFMHLQEALP